jgi:hypothetical protein
MKTLLLLSMLALVACTPKKESLILSFGSTSDSFESVREGTNDSFEVGGPGPENPYGTVTITADGIKIDTLEWGGSMRALGSMELPPKEISFTGNTTVDTYYGISKLDETYKGILLKKGKLEAGEINHMLNWNSNAETYEVNQSR